MSLSVIVEQFSGGVSIYNDPEAQGVSNYLYWVCGKFQLEAQKALNGIGGGTVLPFPGPNPGGGGTGPNPIEFEVSNNSLISEGNNSITLTSYIGFNLLFIRSGVVQGNVDLGASYFSWNKNTGQFICYPVAQEGELFQLYPFY